MASGARVKSPQAFRTKKQKRRETFGRRGAPGVKTLRRRAGERGVLGDHLGFEYRRLATYRGRNMISLSLYPTLL